jgi:hypothetical protein
MFPLLDHGLVRQLFTVRPACDRLITFDTQGTVVVVSGRTRLRPERDDTYPGRIAPAMVIEGARPRIDLETRAQPLISTPAPTRGPIPIVPRFRIRG